MYRAVLVAHLTLEEDGPPINSLMDLLKTNYRIAALQDSSFEAVFLRSHPNSDDHQLKKAGKIFSFSVPVPTFIARMVEKDSAVSDAILFHLYEHVKKSKHYPCRLSRIKSLSRSLWNTGMLFKKNWEFTNIVNYHLLVMKEKGIMERLYHRNMEEPRKLCPNQHMLHRIITDPRPVGATAIFSLCLVLSIGFIAAFILLAVERFCAIRH